MSSQSETAKQNIALWTRLPVVLASASPRRADILQSAGLTFSVRPVDVDEDSMFCAGRNSELALDLAKAKAEAALEAPNRGECIVTADTVVILDGAPLGKPADAAEARSMLGRLRGRSHQVVTGLTVVADDVLHATSVTTTVHFRDYSDSEADAYIATGAPMDKAGGYGIQDLPFAPASDYDGCYLNVVGLPLCGIESLLRETRMTATDAAISCAGHRP